MVPYLSKSIEKKKHNYYVSKENKKQTTNFNVFPHDAAELKKALGDRNSDRIIIIIIIIIIKMMMMMMLMTMITQ